MQGRWAPPAGQPFSGSAQLTLTVSYDGCSPSGGVPTGSAAGTNPLTVCCLP